MPARRIIPCLDVRDGRVVKGIQFRDHRDIGDIVEHALRYRDEGADELVFYDITASAEGRGLDTAWVRRIAKVIDIPFAVAGGIRSRDQAAACLDNGADKVSINSPALERPALIEELARDFGSQCVVLGVDSMEEDGDYFVHQYTGSVEKSRDTGLRTLDWIREAITGTVAATVFHDRIIAIPHDASDSFSSGIAMIRSWKTVAASAPLAWAKVKASRKCSTAPAPPEAITGTVAARAIAAVWGMS